MGRVDWKTGLIFSVATLKRSGTAFSAAMWSVRYSSALIGYRQGASFVWRLPQGDQTITLERVDNSRCDISALRG